MIFLPMICFISQKVAMDNGRRGRHGLHVRRHVQTEDQMMLQGKPDPGPVRTRLLHMAEMTVVAIPLT